MNDALYLDDAYLKEFDATVASVTDGKFVVLDRTAFYPTGGGQPHDTGRMVTDDGREARIIYVGKFGGKVSHQVEPEGALKEGDAIHCIVDWDRRHTLMRYHTAAHVLSMVFHKDCGALITGNQLDCDRSRIDFNIQDFDRELIQACADKANALIRENRPVKVYYLSREEVEQRGLTKLAKGLPEGLKVLRIVEIEDFDVQADGGTHVQNTSEIGTLELMKCENKGKGNRRVYFRLV